MNFVVYGQARTGSSLLVQLLGSHPQIRYTGEILNPNRWRRTIKRYLYVVVRRIPEPYVFWEASRATKVSFGFKLLHNQVPVSPRLMSNLHRYGWQLIHIQRRSLFDVAISRQVARRTQHWGDYEPSLSAIDYEIATEEFLSQLQQCVRIRQKEFHTLADLSHIPVVYEDDLLSEEGRQHICGRIFASLQIELHQVTTTRKRSWDRPYREMISNYIDLQSLMQTRQGQALETEWEQLLTNG